MQHSVDMGTLLKSLERPGVQEVTDKLCAVGLSQLRIIDLIGEDLLDEQSLTEITVDNLTKVGLNMGDAMKVKRAFPSKSSK